MRKHKFIGLLVTIIIIIIGAVMMKFLNKSEERTNEEYMQVFIDNREDFVYVAEIMQQWSFGSIDFEDGISSRHEEIASEIANNEEFYEHLRNLYDLKEIYDIVIEGDEIAFYFSKYPKDYHGGVFYGKYIKENTVTYKIEEHWALRMLPNT